MNNNPALKFNRNDKQLTFNEIKGTLTEKNDGDDWCSITLNVGHENQRLVNLALKKIQFDSIAEIFNIGDRVIARFYLTSRYKNGRWYTIANALQIDPYEPLP